MDEFEGDKFNLDDLEEAKLTPSLNDFEGENMSFSDDETDAVAIESPFYAIPQIPIRSNHTVQNTLPKPPLTQQQQIKIRTVQILAEHSFCIVCGINVPRRNLLDHINYDDGLLSHVHSTRQPTKQLLQSSKNYHQKSLERLDNYEENYSYLKCRCIPLSDKTSGQTNWQHTWKSALNHYSTCQSLINSLGQIKQTITAFSVTDQLILERIWNNPWINQCLICNEDKDTNEKLSYNRKSSWNQHYKSEIHQKSLRINVGNARYEKLFKIRLSKLEKPNILKNCTMEKLDREYKNSNTLNLTIFRYHEVIHKVVKRRGSSKSNKLKILKNVSNKIEESGSCIICGDLCLPVKEKQRNGTTMFQHIDTKKHIDNLKYISCALEAGYCPLECESKGIHSNWKAEDVDEWFVHFYSHFVEEVITKFYSSPAHLLRLTEFCAACEQVKTGPDCGCVDKVFRDRDYESISKKARSEDLPGFSIEFMRCQWCGDVFQDSEKTDDESDASNIDEILTKNWLCFLKHLKTHKKKDPKPVKR